MYDIPLLNLVSLTCQYVPRFRCVTRYHLNPNMYLSGPTTHHPGTAMLRAKILSSLDGFVFERGEWPSGSAGFH